MIPRAWGIADFFVRPFDSVFQEALALSHIKYGLGVTKGIAGFGIFDGQFLYHAAHPPLLQLIYACLYAIFGVHEWVSRAFCTLMAVGTALCLWGALIKAGARKAAFATALFFSLINISVEVGRTTNYEPGALFFISLIILGFTMRTERTGIALITIAVLIGGLFEWTVYLALPAVAIATLIEERSLKSLRYMVLPAAIAALALAVVLIWQYSVVGIIPMLGHASTRSDPGALFASANWVKALSYPVRGIGFGWLLVILGLFQLRALHKKSPRITGILIAYALIPVLFLITAPQLVLSHHLATLYIVPPAAILIGLIAEELKPGIAWPLIGLLLVYYAVADVKSLRVRSPLFYDFANFTADRIEDGEQCKAFDSAAVGYLRYYHAIETFHAVGANEPPLDEFIRDEKVCAFMVDVSHHEVDYVKRAVDRGATGGRLYLAARAHGIELWLRDDGDGVIRLANMLDSAQQPPHSERWWENPSTEIMVAGGKARFGILHHSRPDADSVLRFKNITPANGTRFVTAAVLDPRVCNTRQSDGVKYVVRVSGGEWSKEMVGIIDPTGCDPTPIAMDIDDESDNIDIELIVNPNGGPEYDRFLWEDPRIIKW